VHGVDKRELDRFLERYGRAKSKRRRSARGMMAVVPEVMGRYRIPLNRKEWEL